MWVLLLTLAAFVVAMAGMAIGVALRGRPLSGSCGGVSGTACPCGKRPESCPRKQAEPQQR